LPARWLPRAAAPRTRGPGPPGRPRTGESPSSRLPGRLASARAAGEGATGSSCPVSSETGAGYALKFAASSGARPMEFVAWVATWSQELRIQCVRGDKLAVTSRKFLRTRYRSIAHVPGRLHLRLCRRAPQTRPTFYLVARTLHVAITLRPQLRAHAETGAGANSASWRWSAPSMPASALLGLVGAFGVSSRVRGQRLSRHCWRSPPVRRVPAWSQRPPVRGFCPGCAMARAQWGCTRVQGGGALMLICASHRSGFAQRYGRIARPCTEDCSVIGGGHDRHLLVAGGAVPA
jgi:hypothetical protein